MSFYPLPPADIRELLAIASDVQAMASDFSLRLSHVLAELARLTHARTAAAFELKAPLRQRQQAMPLLELTENAGRHGWTPLVRSPSLGHLRLIPIERVSRASTQIGIPSWAVEFLGVRELRHQKHVLYSVQYPDDLGVSFGILLARDAAAGAFTAREEALVDTAWRSNRIQLGGRSASAKASLRQV